MKIVISSLVFFSTLSALAASAPSIICRDDRRMERGALRELILTPKDGGYHMQSQYVPSLNSPEIVIENWAEKLTCRIEKTLAFCQNQENQSSVLFKERREVFLDSLEEDAKKKTNKYTDISLHENGVQQKVLSFASSHCQILGEA